MNRVMNYWKKWRFTGLKLYLYKKNIFSNYITFNLPELEETIYLRHDTSDVKTFDKVFLEDEYDFKPDHPPGFIIDAGANIGAASVYLAHKYPNARIISIEPEKSNFKILLKNTKNYKNISCLNKALWHINEPLVIKNPDVNKESFEIQRSNFTGDDLIESITINQLVQDYDIPNIDILKIDIEGAEKEIFSHNTEWIDKVSLIFIEFHDRKTPGCKESFFKAIKAYAERTYQKGETAIVVMKPHHCEIE